MGMSDETQDLWETCTLLGQQVDIRLLTDPVVVQTVLDHCF